MTQFEQQREETERIMNTTSETNGTKTKCLIFMSPEFWKKRGIRVEVKSTQRHMAENLPNLAKDLSLQIQEAEKTLKRIRPKKSTPR